jgi:choline dehydrogenase-like flavoprotein
VKPVVVVGSGPSGVHFALTVLEKGRRVTLVDVGHARPSVIRQHDTFDGLKRNLDDPVEYLLGNDLEGITYPGAAGEYYGVPPGKAYIFRDPGGFTVRSQGFEPLFSWAAGGLAEAWTGGVYPFNEAELADFPFGWSDIEPSYAEVARRIGISGEIDDLSRFMPAHDGIMPPLELDLHSRKLIDRYTAARAGLNDAGCWLGRSRLATITRPHAGRGACEYLGRCLWGCPVDALYTPSKTLAECMAFDRFEYVPGVVVTHFTVDSSRRIRKLRGHALDGSPFEQDVDTLVLAAGALSSARIFLESVHRATGEAARLTGLMDNLQILVPFLNFDMIGLPYQPSSYQYHMLGLGLETDRPEEYVHGQITTLKTTMAHPILNNLPFDLRTARQVFRRIRSGLGLVNVNFHDRRRDDCAVSIEPDPAGGNGTLVIEYRDDPGEEATARAAVARVRKALRSLRCFAPSPMIHVRPRGASVHYAGVLPMTDRGGDFTTTPECRSRDFENLVMADGATFPFLPAKNITFTLMANAVRAASAL